MPDTSPRSKVSRSSANRRPFGSGGAGSAPQEGTTAVTAAISPSRSAPSTSTCMPVKLRPHRAIRSPSASGNSDFAKRTASR